MNDPPAKSHENSSKNTNSNKIQHSQNAETHLTAFSPIFHCSAKQGHSSTGMQQVSKSLKQDQTSPKRNSKAPTINRSYQNNAQQNIKTSENLQKAAHQNEGVPTRISTPNLLHPPVNQPQKVQFQSQIKQTTRANLIQATSTAPLQYSCPVFTPYFQKIRENSSLEVNFAAFPAAPASATLYNVESISNVPD